MRYYRYMYEDNFNGVTNHYRGELVDRRPITSKLVPPTAVAQKLLGKRAASTKMGKRFLEKLEGLGIK